MDALDGDKEGSEDSLHTDEDLDEKTEGLDEQMESLLDDKDKPDGDVSNRISRAIEVYADGLRDE